MPAPTDFSSNSFNDLEFRVCVCLKGAHEPIVSGEDYHKMTVLQGKLSEVDAEMKKLEENKEHIEKELDNVAGSH